MNANIFASNNTSFVGPQSDTVVRGIVAFFNIGDGATDAAYPTGIATDTIVTVRFRIKGQGASRIHFIRTDSLATSFLKTTNNATTISTFDSFLLVYPIFLGHDSTSPIVGSGFIADNLFVSGTGRNITSTIFDSSAVAGYDTVRLFFDTALAGVLSGNGFRAVPGTTNDTGKTRTFTFAISDTNVRRGDSFVYYIEARDTRGNRGTFADSNAGSFITISGGIRPRIFIGGPSSDTEFARDSSQLVAGAWRDSSQTARTFLTVNQNQISFRVQATDTALLADSIAFFLDTGLGYRFLGQGFFSNGFCSAYITSSLTFSLEVDTVIAIIRDTTTNLPDVMDTGRIFFENFAPTAARADTILNSGGVLTDTRRVNFNFGSTGGQVSDTNPNGIKFFRIQADTSLGMENTNAYRFADSLYFDIPDSMINAETGVARIFFQFEDDAGNRSTAVLDTIVVDFVTPLIRAGNGGNIGSLGSRAKAVAITVLANIVDTGGVSTVVLRAKHRNDSGNYTAIAMSLSTGNIYDGVWTGTIPTSIVGAIAETTNGVEYFISCTDLVGRTSSYRDSASPESIPIIVGMSFRTFLGESSAAFTTESKTLTAAVWSDTSGRSARTILSLNETNVPAAKLQLIESTGLADSAEIFLNGVRIARITSFSANFGETTSAFVFNLETNTILVAVFDSNSSIPTAYDTGIVFIDKALPTVDTPSNLIAAGLAAIDTRRVNIDVGATISRVRDTGPNVIFRYTINDTSNFNSLGNAIQRIAFGDTTIYLTDPYISNPAGLATLYFQFEDDATNLSAVFTDTIIVDLDSPHVRTDSGANIGVYNQRAKGNQISVIARLRDTSGIAAASLFARHRTDSSAYSTITMTLTTGTVYDGLWTGTIPTSIVGAIADTTRGVEFFLSCTDVVGRFTKYADSATPESIPIIDGLGVRVFVGSSLNFATDSRELSSSTWRDSATNRSYFTLDTTVLFVNDPGGLLVRVIETTLLGDTFFLSFDTGSGFANNAFNTAGQIRIGDSGQLSFSGIRFPLDTTTLRVEVFDTSGVGIPPFTDDGKFFVDVVVPTLARPDSVINSGGILTDTVAVTLNFGSTGGQASDTGPLGVRALFVSDTSGAIGTEYLYSDTRSFSLTTNFFNIVSGAATLYFRLQDYTGNYSATTSDTILVDSIAPVINIGNGGNIGNIGSRAKGQPITVTANIVDSGGISAATLYARHRNDSSTYTAIAMSISSGDLRQGVWSGIIPTTIIGAIADTSIGVEFFLQCTDVVGRGTLYKSAASPESIGIVNGVDGRVYTKLPRDTNGATSEYTEITSSGELGVQTGISPTLRISSAIGDTVRVKRVRGGDSDFQIVTRIDFADTVIVLPAASLQHGDSIVVYISDSTVNLAYEDTFFLRIDNTVPTIASFLLDPNKTAVDSVGVRVRVTTAATEKNIRFFVSQTADTLGGLLNNASTQFTGSAFDSASATVFPQINVTPTADTVTLFISAWDDAGNVAANVQLSFVVDRSAPIVSITAVPAGRPVSETVTVNATVTDTTFSLGLQSVQLGVIVSGTTDTYTMTLLSGTTFRGTIPAAKIGATAGTVNFNVSAVDTFGRLGNATSSFTTLAQSVRISNGTETTTADTIFTTGATGYISVFAPSDSVTETNVLTSVVNTSLNVTDTANFTVGLAAGINQVVILRTSIYGDVQTLTRWFVSDSTAPNVNSVSLDTGALVSGDTLVVLTFTSSDSFGVASYQLTGDIVESSTTFIGFNGASSFQRTVTLTSAAGAKTCTVVVRDSAGNTSAGVSDTIALQLGLGTTISATYNPTTGETVAAVDRTANDNVSETVTFLQGTTDTIVCQIGQTGTNGDTIRFIIDFADTIRQAFIIVSVPDTVVLTSSSDSINLIGNFILGQRTIREITVQDSLGATIGEASSSFNRFRRTWTLDSALQAVKTSLEIFFFDTVSRRWLIARTDSRIVNQSLPDSFLNYATGDTISILTLHNGIMGVFPTGGFSAALPASSIIVYPNPYVPYDGDQSNGEQGTATAGIRIGNVPSGSKIQIFDLRGRLVDEIPDAGTTGLVVWDARNQDNQEVVSGVYLIVVKGGGGTAVRKVAIVR